MGVDAEEGWAGKTGDADGADLGKVQLAGHHLAEKLHKLHRQHLARQRLLQPRAKLAHKIERRSNEEGRGGGMEKGREKGDIKGWFGVQEGGGLRTNRIL